MPKSLYNMEFLAYEWNHIQYLNCENDIANN